MSDELVFEDPAQALLYEIVPELRRPVPPSRLNSLRVAICDTFDSKNDNSWIAAIFFLFIDLVLWAVMAAVGAIVAAIFHFFAYANDIVSEESLPLWAAIGAGLVTVVVVPAFMNSLFGSYNRVRKTYKD